MSSVTHARACLANATRFHGPDAPQTVAARRDLFAASLEAHIEKVVASAPPLTAAQKAKLRALLAEDGS